MYENCLKTAMEKALDEQLRNNKFTDNTGKFQKSGCYYTSIPRVVKCKGIQGRPLTSLNLDKTDLLETLLEIEYGGSEEAVLGEMQFAFVAFLMGQSLEAFIQCKSLVSLLFGCIEAVNKSVGPFDALFCVGQFFSDSPERLDEFTEYIEGRAKFPLPTYFIGDYGVGAPKVLLAASRNSANLGFEMDGFKICENLFWLKGRRSTEVLSKLVCSDLKFLEREIFSLILSVGARNAILELNSRYFSTSPSVKKDQKNFVVRPFLKVISLSFHRKANLLSALRWQESKLEIFSEK